MTLLRAQSEQQPEPLHTPSSTIDSCEVELICLLYPVRKITNDHIFAARSVWTPKIVNHLP